MLVSVTGATGFLGAHAVAAIVRAGHRVRVLVRESAPVDARVAAALDPLGVDPSAVCVVAGDVTDPARVAGLVRGADAVLHAASVYSFDSRDHRAVAATNARGTEVVLGAARAAGVGRTIHVSSVGALLPARGRPLDEDSPLGAPRETYLASKAAADAIARRHRADGAPVLISYPSALIGPHDPRLGDQNARVRNALRGLMPIWPTGGIPVGDVRDTAELHATLLSTPDTATGRHFGPGHYLSTREFMAVLREVTGRRLPAVRLPARAMLPLGALTGALQRVWPWHIPAEYGAIYTCACASAVSDTADTAGVHPRPVTETFRDTVRWLHRDGRLTDRQAGAVGRERTEVSPR
ncbi:NAD-dependent epimerase/dehydratase family protein [Actinokineospora diospyrosa]|uniref:Nucleoside-diphosphate-sugar epimerase n=1 Tax=Actinokineospora diospyrosa TaxID=103728 RepID=A0ABT1IEF2_9PSEU|nr:NAD-dependent epimerase/dehydratase family protein [Actinokineospora diospyrosa]MCP2270995.1 Nucleoside-diphosphate-sugar epimerase [Actinokineospora diospyrosa]